MTADSVKQTVENIVTDLQAVQDLAAGIDPALTPFIAIGRAVENQLPGLAATITGWLQGNAPTDQEKQALVQQLTTLDNPDLP